MPGERYIYKRSPEYYFILVIVRLHPLKFIRYIYFLLLISYTLFTRPNTFICTLIYQTPIHILILIERQMRRTNARNTSSSAQQPRQQISERLSNSHAGQASTLKRPSQDVSNTLNQQLTQQIQSNVPQLLLPTTEDQLSDTEIASLSEVSEIAETVFDILPNPPADDQEQLSSEESGRDQRGFGYSTVCKSSISTKKKK